MTPYDVAKLRRATIRLLAIGLMLTSFPIIRLVNRELQPWIPDGDGEALEGLSSNPSQTDRLGRWDQFAANKAQFGVNTTFNEDVSSHYLCST